MMTPISLKTNHYWGKLWNLLFTLTIALFVVTSISNQNELDYGLSCYVLWWTLHNMYPSMGHSGAVAINLSHWLFQQKGTFSHNHWLKLIICSVSKKECHWKINPWKDIFGILISQVFLQSLPWRGDECQIPLYAQLSAWDPPESKWTTNSEKWCILP